MKARLALGIASGLTALLIAVATTRADPNLGNIPAHRHFIRTANGDFQQIGPDVCDNPNLQKAFNQFHNNIHVVSATGIGPAAPGLHNGIGADLFAGRC
jgi:hypothetical protein